MIRRLLACLLLLALLPLCAAAEEKQEPTLDDRVDAVFRRYHTLGGEVVVAKDGVIVYQHCYGYSSWKKDEPVTPDHYYRLASVSKLISAVAVMRLVDVGRLDLDANLGTILGTEKPFFAANPKYRTTGITTRMLMSHTSGIWDSHFATKRPLREAIDVKTAYRTSFYEEKPGTKYHYSNYAAGILGCVIEAVTGMRLNDAAALLLFEPLGLDAAYDPEFLRHPERITSDFFRPYGEEIDLDRDYYHTYGGCWMKCADLCRVGMMLCDYGFDGEDQYLSESVVKEMLSSQQGKGGITADSPYGLNVQRLEVPELFPGRVVYGHQGRADDILCNVYFDPETRFVFAMVTNSCSPGDMAYGIRTPAWTLLSLMAKEFLR